MIRPFIRSFVYIGAALWMVNSLSGGGIQFANGPKTFLLTILALSIANHFVRPLINILLLPINLLSLGLFRWVTNVLILYAVTVLVRGFGIAYFHSQAVVWGGIAIPEINLVGIGAFILVSFLLSFISSFFYWLAK